MAGAIARSIKRPEIVFILAPPRSFTSITCAMLGQHPEMYGVPELRLFTAETVGDWIQQCSEATYQMASGTLRTLAQLVFGAQTDKEVRMAQRWLNARSDWTTYRVVKLISRLVHPQVLVDKSPNVVYRPEALRRMFRLFPNARFIHLLRHPRGHGESVMKLKAYLESSTGQPLPPDHWIVHLCLFASAGRDCIHERRILDPQCGWYALNKNICRFLACVPRGQRATIRSEDVLSQPDISLRRLAGWMGFRTDATAIEAMKHPERSPFIGFGPEDAHKGNDPVFLADPILRLRTVRLSLEGPLSWRADGGAFLPEVVQLAQSFGYT